MKSFTTALFVLLLLSIISTENIYSQAQLYDTGAMQMRVDTYGAMRFWTIEGTDTVQHLCYVDPDDRFGNSSMRSGILSYRYHFLSGTDYRAQPDGHLGEDNSPNYVVQL